MTTASNIAAETSAAHRGVITLAILGVFMASCSKPPDSPDQDRAGPSAQYTQEGQPGNNALRPNILLIVADDLGYTDIGAFGGEIETPNLDKLALAGVRLTNYRTSPMCSVTRAMLISGTDNHIAGLGAQSINDAVRGHKGYEGYLHSRIRPLPELVGEVGYRTYMAGKWHLGSEPSQSPMARGFDASFALLEGAASHLDKSGISKRDPEGTYLEDDLLVESLPEDFYSTRHYTDKIIEYLDRDRNNDRPFFAYVAYTAPHWPLQVPDEYADLYSGKYEEGFDKLRESRVAGAVRMGVLSPVASTAKFAEPLIGPRWDNMDAAARKESARKMEIYAAMVDVMDRQIGRLIDYLDQSKQLGNTVVIFMSDNGADGSILETKPLIEYVKEHNNLSFENMGKRGSFVLYGPGWASASGGISRLYKGFMTDGGHHAPAFIWRANSGNSHDVNHQLITVMDIAPTILEVAGGSHMYGELRDGTPLPVPGTSFASLLRNPDSPDHEAERAIAFELHGQRAVYRDNWKLLWIAPTQTGTFEGYEAPNRWELFDIVADPAEAHDVSLLHPQIVTELSRAWDDYVEVAGVVSH